MLVSQANEAGKNIHQLKHRVKLVYLASFDALLSYHSNSLPNDHQYTSMYVCAIDSISNSLTQFTLTPTIFSIKLLLAYANCIHSIKIQMNANV